MARGRRGQDFSDGSVFPFISVLLCTMGAMALVWIAYSLAVSFADPRRRQEAEALEQHQRTFAEEVAQRRLALASLAELVSEHGERYGSLQASLAARRQELERAEAEAEAVAARLRELRRRLDAAVQAEAELQALEQRLQRAEALRAAEARRARLEAEREGLERLRAQLAERERRLAERQAEIAEMERELARLGEGKTVELRVLGEQALRLQLLEVAAQGLRPVPAAAEQPFVPVAAATARDGLLAQAAVATGADDACLVLLVRPDAAAVYRQAATYLRDVRARFTAEPADADWDLGRVRLPEGP